MKVCNSCHLHVSMENKRFCPLCGSELHTEATPGPAPAFSNRYPDLSGTFRHYHFIWRLLMFLTLLGCFMSILINWLVTPDFLWCLIVLAAAAYCWITIPPLLRRGANYATRTVWQVIFTGAFVVALDFILGYSGWSIDYVIPSILCGGILVIWLMAIINRTNWSQYLFSAVWMTVFAFFPLVMYLLDVSQSLLMALVTAGFGVASLLIFLVFGDRSVKSEFKRRFHL